MSWCFWSSASVAETKPRKLLSRFGFSGFTERECCPANGLVSCIQIIRVGSSSPKSPGQAHFAARRGCPEGWLSSEPAEVLSASLFPPRIAPSRDFYYLLNRECILCKNVLVFFVVHFAVVGNVCGFWTEGIDLASFRRAVRIGGSAQLTMSCCKTKWYSATPPNAA